MRTFDRLAIDLTIMIGLILKYFVNKLGHRQSSVSEARTDSSGSG